MIECFIVEKWKNSAECTCTVMCHKGSKMYKMLFHYNYNQLPSKQTKQKLVHVYGKWVFLEIVTQYQKNLKILWNKVW
jgi:hypothetical protein